MNQLITSSNTSLWYMQYVDHSACSSVVDSRCVDTLPIKVRMLRTILQSCKNVSWQQTRNTCWNSNFLIPRLISSDDTYMVVHGLSLNTNKNTDSLIVVFNCVLYYKCFARWRQVYIVLSLNGIFLTKYDCLKAAPPQIDFKSLQKCSMRASGTDIYILLLASAWRNRIAVFHIFSSC